MTIFKKKSRYRGEGVPTLGRFTPRLALSPPPLLKNPGYASVLQVWRHLGMQM